jgi:hypothetical protein
MSRLSPQCLLAQRERRYRRRPDLRVENEEDARRFVDQVGLALLFPIKQMQLPSLWEAINGCARAVPRRHSDEALGKTWTWKDTLPARGLVYYGKLLRNKATFLSLDVLPSFYALSPNFGGEDDYLQEYDDGRLSREAKDICDLLLVRGELPTGELRRLAHLSTRSHKYRFERAIVELQRKLVVAKVGIADAGPWHYSYVYDLFVRAYPAIVEAARFLVPLDARRRIVRRYLQSTVISSRRYLSWLFSWDREAVDETVEGLLHAGEAEEIFMEDWGCECVVTDVRSSLAERNG